MVVEFVCNSCGAAVKVKDQWSFFAPFSATIPFDAMNVMFSCLHMLMRSTKQMPLEELQKQLSRATALVKLMGATYPEEYPEYVQVRLQLFSLRIAGGVGSHRSPQTKDVEGACRNGLGLVSSMERLYGNTQDLLGFVRERFCV